MQCFEKLFKIQRVGKYPGQAPNPPAPPPKSPPKIMTSF